MWLAPFPLPRVESLAPREGAKNWTRAKPPAGLGWAGQREMCRARQPRERKPRTRPPAGVGGKRHTKVAWNDMCAAQQRFSLARHKARGMQGIWFQAFHFCTHCEGQTLTRVIPPTNTVSLSLC